MLYLRAQAQAMLAGSQGDRILRDICVGDAARILPCANAEKPVKLDYRYLWKTLGGGDPDLRGLDGFACGLPSEETRIPQPSNVNELGRCMRLGQYRHYVVILYCVRPAWQIGREANEGCHLRGA